MKKSELGKEIRRNWDKYLMVLPFTLIFFIFTVLPVLASIVLSFTDFNMLQPPAFNGISNYIRMLMDDDIIMTAARNTLIFAVLTGPLSYALCLVFAWMVNEFGKNIRNLLTFIFYIPSISGSMFVIWSYIFSGDPSGLVNSFLINMGLTDSAILWLSDSKYIMLVLIIVQLWTSLGTSFLSFIAGFQGIDRAMYEAGIIDGVSNRFQELRLITLPAMGPQLMFAAVMQIGASFAAGSISIALLGNPSTDYAGATITTHLLDVGTSRYEMGYASAIAVLLFAVMVLTNNGISKLLNRYTDM